MYIINKTNGQILVELLDGTADGPDVNPGLNVCDINLIGKNYPAYGTIQNENFVRLLENFANSTEPANPIAGQLWYDTTTAFLKVFNGTNFVAINPLAKSGTAPLTANSVLGDLWWNTTTDQFYIYSGLAWTLIGPGYSKLDGKSGAITETVYDTLGNKHTVIKMYNNNNVTAIVSYDTAFTPNVSISGFTSINPGINLSNKNNITLTGTAVNSLLLGNVAPTQYARKDINESFAGNISIGSSAGTISSTDNNLDISNNSLNGNIALYANYQGNKARLLTVVGETGEVQVSRNPITGSGIATKNYVDTLVINTASLLAPKASPALTGVPTAPTPPEWSSNTQIATTLYVDVQDAQILNYVDALVGSTTANLEARLTRDEMTFAPNANPVLSGIPRAPTPGVNDNSSQIATTAFTQAAITSGIQNSRDARWLGSYKFVNTSTPTQSDGENGDFWFQI